MLNRQMIFPMALILLNLGAACYCMGWRLVVFYVAAAAINFVQVF